MSLERKQVGRAVTTNRVLQILKNDEHLLRLLHLPYKDANGHYQDPLDETLPNIIGTPEQYKIGSENIINTIKLDEVSVVQECMVFVHQGKRRPVFGNKLLARQEILIDVLVHNDYQEYDYRLDDICDRLDYLLVHNRIVMGEIDISTPIPMEAPKEYYRYQMKYIYWDKKK